MKITNKIGFFKVVIIIITQVQTFLRKKKTRENSVVIKIGV